MGHTACPCVPVCVFRVSSEEIGNTRTINASRPEQNGQHTDGISKCISFDENDRISNKIGMEVLAKSTIDKNSILGYVMISRQTGDMLFAEPMMIQFTDAIWAPFY